MNESKNHDVVWEFDNKIQKWTMSLKEKSDSKSNSKGKSKDGKAN